MLVQTFVPIIKRLIGPAIAFGLGLFICTLSLDPLEYIFYDLRVMSKPHHSLSDKIRIVLTDNHSIELYHGQPGLDKHIELLKILKKQNPKAVVYVSKIESLPGTEEQKTEFARLASEFPIFYQATGELEQKWEEGSLQMPPPLNHIKVFPAPQTQDNRILAKDDVTRRLMLNYQNRPLMHWSLAQEFNPDIAQASAVRGEFQLYETDQAFIDYVPKNAFKTSPIQAVVDQRIDTDFEGKIVLIGEDLQLDFKDYVKTPYSKNPLALPHVEMHANMIETLIKNSSPHKAPIAINYLITLLVCLLTVQVALNAKPTRGIIFLTACAFGYIVICTLLFWTLGLWVEVAHPLLAIFICYYFFIPYRLILENRKSWEYYQKHKLLSEVELLKTNFIGMMSHDLKTPLARIQGMSDLILKDPVTLSHSQRDALDTIRQSTHDLTKFIEAILRYAQIESAGVVLHKQSKDLNELLKEVIKKNEFTAKLKHIQIQFEMEPLFSVSIDPDLMRQVFSNLIENAIKYSPENSKILITSEEQNGQILVQIADQGVGIPADELDNIFMKFFRSKHAKTSTVKGSGLGLYLAKYFVELHQGKISCESSIGQGSTFTVEIPS